MAGRGCTVFVGNVDFDIPEEKIVEELSAVGRVVAFRMVTDRTTGKSKGYGFCTYESPIVADMAVNKLKIMLNNRSVKINYADNNVAPVQEEAKVDTEALAESLDRMAPEDAKEILKHVKRLAVNRQDELKKMLQKSPSLLSALLHMIFTLGLAPKETLEDLLQSSFSVTKQNAQLLSRILQYHDYEVESFPSPLREKALKIRERLLKRSHHPRS
ncbi:cleavage stimulation factor subunit 2 [Nematocida homosporus]|uniref:cleavage stimulation factor subunit 2 n=1 Tax=Nematocida homosporus TaxID=1912981 RepID=UPI002220D102|nr:cleavage stimulation factor subunit 2 [Nematocida homosporus]KAI5185152.1 cleavage stimulation factor subunit 2 [Nematocida homosporus]